MPNECLESLSLTVFTQINFVTVFFKRSAILHGKRHFEPPLKGLRTTYDDHLSLIGKRVVDFLLVLIEFFSLRLRRYERISVKNRRFRSNGGRLTQYFR